jgi:hypothetical protein
MASEAMLWLRGPLAGIATRIGRLGVADLTSRLPRSTAAARAIEWLPALTAAAYVAVVAAKFPALGRALYWNSDAAGAFVLAELVPGHGTVEIPRFGWWTSLWWLLATRGVPGHEHLWEATAYVFAVATAAIVGWATSRVAGRWGGVTAAAATIVVGPMTLTSLVLVNFHTSTPFTAAVLAAYLVLLARSRSLLLASLVGALVGVNAASDPLLWIAGVVPFVVGAGVLAFATKARDVASRAAVTLGVAVVSAVATDAVMRSSGFHVIPVGLRPADVSDLFSNFMAVGKSIALLYGANFVSRPTYPSDPLRYAMALFAFAALAATLLAAARLSIRRSEPMTWAYACFWATAAVLISIAYWTSSLGSGGGFAGGLNYMLTLAPAAGVGIVLVARGSSKGRIAASLAIGAVGAVNMSGVAHGRAELRFPAGVYGPQIIELLEREDLTRGYASFWDAQSLTWKSGMRVLIAPVKSCDARGSGALCRVSFFTIDSWYEERPGRSFLIVNPLQGFRTKPPAEYGRPSEVKHLGSDVTVYVYPYDLARHIRE